VGDAAHAVALAEFYVMVLRVQSQHIVYTSGMISSNQKGGRHGLEGNDSDGAENRVHYRMAIRSLFDHRTEP
jgi:hypothetical protein